MLFYALSSTSLSSCTTTVSSTRSSTAPFLATAYVDAYTGRVRVPKVRYQLVGVAAILVACSLYPAGGEVDSNEMAYITDRTYTPQQVERCAAHMRAVLRGVLLDSAAAQEAAAGAGGVTSGGSMKPPLTMPDDEDDILT